MLVAQCPQMLEKAVVGKFPERDPSTVQQATLCLLIQKNGEEREILLAMKKAGFGKDKWNGPGGKIENGESIEDCVLRELGEEVGVEVTFQDLQKMALLHFYFPGGTFDQDVHVFMTNTWHKTPQESEEMKPEWFQISKIPYSQMWSSDIFWLPLVLKGECIEASFRFDEKREIASYQIKPLVLR